MRVRLQQEGFEARRSVLRTATPVARDTEARLAGRQPVDRRV